MHAACVALRPQLAYETHIDRLLRIYEDVRGRRGTPGKP
jgi:hypothetical protein